MRVSESVMNESSSFNTPHLKQSLQTIHEFLGNFPPEEIPVLSWELLQCAFASDDADIWSPNERSRMLFFYHKLCALAPALAMVDKEFRFNAGKAVRSV
jgi:hypothetical protein